MRTLAATVLLLALGLTALPVARADVPRALSFAGNLSSAAGPLSGPVAMTFTVYADPESSDPSALLWSETLDLLSDDGSFVAVLGADAANPFPTDLLDHPELFLGVQVEDDPEMAPRLSVGSVPYAVRSANADQLGGQPSSAYAGASHGHTMSEISGMVPAGQLPGAIVMEGEAGSVSASMLASGAVQLAHLGDMGCSDQSSLMWLDAAGHWSCVPSWVGEAGGLSTDKPVHIGEKAATGDAELDVVGQLRVRDSFPVGAPLAYASLTLSGLFEDPVLAMETASSAAYLATQAATGTFELGSSGGFELKSMVPKATGPLAGGTSVLRVTASGWAGLGTSTPLARLDVVGDGSSPEAGMLALRNVGELAGIRIYDGTSPKFAIWNKLGNASPLLNPPAEIGDVLRLSPEYLASIGKDTGLTIDETGAVWVGRPPEPGEFMWGLAVRSGALGQSPKLVVGDPKSSSPVILLTGAGNLGWMFRANDATNGLEIRDDNYFGCQGKCTSGSLFLSRTAVRVGINNPGPAAGLDLLGNGDSWADGFLFLRNKKDQDSGIRLYGGTTGSDIKWHLFNAVGAGNKLRIAPEGSAVVGGITVDQSGNVSIGTTTPDANTQLQITGTARKPGGGSWASSSDRRLKKNIHTLTGSLDRLLRLRGVTYEWRDPENHGNMVGAIMGMIAQEVREVFPEWVGTDGKGFLTLGFIGFEALTVEAVRELNEHDVALEEANAALHGENQALQEQNQALQGEVDDLRARLEAIEARLQ